MANKQVSPADLEGKALDDWYRRTPDEIEQERRLRADQAYDEFFGDGGWREARYKSPTARPAPPPVETRAGYPPGSPPVAGAPDSFFDSYRPLPFSNEYRAPLPPPLDRVERSMIKPNMYVLSDRTLVTAEELERVYAEQARRMAGQDEEQPAPRRVVRRVDRVPNGTIPDAGAMAQGEREEDPSCHPYGGWEPEQPDSRRSQRSRDYEAQINRAPGLNYVVRSPDGDVAFDGCAVWDPRRQLLEAKGPGYAGLVPLAPRPKFEDFNEGPSRQAQRQARVAKGRPVDWHVAEKGAFPFFRDRVEIAPNLRVHHTPARANPRLVRRYDKPTI